MDSALGILSNNILITGSPGIGKTTLILQLNDYLKDNYHISGFYTGEIRKDGIRTGFNITTFDGIEKILASTALSSHHRVGKYGVSLSNLDEIVNQLSHMDETPDFWFIDEIGKMESFSRNFRSFIDKIFVENTPVIATIAKSAGGWISDIRQHHNAKLVELNYDNRDTFLQNLIHEIFSNQTRNL